MAENASLIVSTQGKYVGNVEWDFPAKPDYSVFVEYADPKTGAQIALKKKLGKSMGKNEFDFLKFAVFGIRNNPEKIH